MPVNAISRMVMFKLGSILLLVLSLGACSSAKPTPTPAATSGASGAATPAATAAATQRPSTPAAGGGGGIAGNVICSEWARTAAASSRLSGPPTGGTADFRTSLEAASTALNSFAQTGPPELRADLQLYAKNFGEFNAAFAKVNYDFTRLASDPGALRVMEAMSSPQMEQAGKNIQAWTEKNCTIGR